MKRASQAERITALKAEVVLRDPYQFKATAGAGVEIIAVAKGAIGLGGNRPCASYSAAHWQNGNRTGIGNRWPKIGNRICAVTYADDLVAMI
jgi:hypothetical protein